VKQLLFVIRTHVTIIKTVLSKVIKSYVNVKKDSNKRISIHNAKHSMANGMTGQYVH